MTEATALRWRGAPAIAHDHHAILCEIVDPALATVSLFLDRDDGAPSEIEVLVLVPEAVEGIASIVRDVVGQGGEGIVAEPVAEADWVASSQRYLKPVIAGRFVVHGSHDRARGRLSRNAIEIDAGQAFGTAHHETTVGCLEAIDLLARTGEAERAADVGAGTAVLAIAIAKSMPATRVLASDIDPIAVEVARQNVRLNGCSGRIEVEACTGLAHPAYRRMRPFDLMVANILARPLMGMAGDFAGATEAGGRLILSGILTRQARSVLARYRAAGFRLERRREIGQWTTLTLARI
ncbi:MAG: methyltransferase [Rhizobiales bacterium]|nr:methyltransferase [Hyphomicrobiales bacterium]